MSVRTRYQSMNVLYPKRTDGCCRYCGDKITDKRRSAFCCQDHSDEAWKATYADNCRWNVEKRDHGICSMCGAGSPTWEWKSFGQNGKLKKLVKVEHYIEWQAHHVIPFIEGGKNDITNIRTLCTTCHGFAHRKPYRGKGR